MLCASGSAVVPLLATQLAVGLLNLAVTAYVAHRVHKLDKKIDAFKAETNIRLDLVTSGISNIQVVLSQTAQATSIFVFRTNFTHCLASMGGAQASAVPQQ